MIRISLTWLSDAVVAIHDLTKLSPEDDKLKSIFAILNAQAKLKELYDSSIYIPFLRISFEKAQILRESLEQARAGMANMTSPIKESDRLRISAQATSYLNILRSEIGVIPAFLVTPKGAYDANSIAEAGSLLFPSDLPKKVRGTEKDMLEVGKALAFELPTSCGFHTFRVLESTLKQYWDHVTKGAMRPKLQTIGSFSVELQKGKHGDEKVWETLSQIAKLHRNPIIHPEVMLTLEEAVETLGIVRSAIGAMLKHMPELPNTTTEKA